MRPEARQVHATRTRRLVKTCQDSFLPVNVRRRHPRPVPILVEKLEPLVQEVNDHL